MSDTKLDEVLRHHIGNYETVDSYGKSINEAKQAIKQLMADEFEKLIGKDEITDIQMSFRQGKNKLRQKLKEWKDEQN